MVQADAKLQGVPERRVLDILQDILKLKVLHVQKLLWPLVRHRVSDDVIRGDPGLSPRGDENQHRLAG